MRREREHLKHVATHDPLTNLLNRAAFKELLQHAVEAARPGVSSALLFLDLDNFKLINDSLGHTAGDSVLAEVAAVLRDSVRTDGVSGRFGDDEFCVLLKEVCLPEAESIADRLRSRLEELHFSNAGRTFAVSSSIGIATIDGTATGKACPPATCCGPLRRTT